MSSTLGRCPARSDTKASCPCILKLFLKRWTTATKCPIANYWGKDEEALSLTTNKLLATHQQIRPPNKNPWTKKNNMSKVVVQGRQGLKLANVR